MQYKVLFALFDSSKPLGRCLSAVLGLTLRMLEIGVAILTTIS
jgi:hypothetical protein